MIESGHHPAFACGFGHPSGRDPRLADWDDGLSVSSKGEFAMTDNVGERAKLVAVRAYERFRFRRLEKVCAHFRSYPHQYVFDFMK